MIGGIVRQYLLVVGAMLFMFTAMAFWPHKSRQDVELEIRNKTVRINAIQGDDVYGCTGTLLSHNFILTNAHCVPKGIEHVYIRRINDREFKDAVIISSATKMDYALLSFSGVDRSDRVDFTRNWQLGEEIILYGNPGIREFVIGHSHIVGYSFVYTPQHKLRTMLIYPCDASAPGFSGSGIYSTDGEYLGTSTLGEEIPILYQIMTQLAGEPKQGPLCFAIPAKEAMERNLDRPWLGFNLGDK